MCETEWKKSAPGSGPSCSLLLASSAHLLAAQYLVLQLSHLSPLHRHPTNKGHDSRRRPPRSRRTRHPCSSRLSRRAGGIRGERGSRREGQGVCGEEGCQSDAEHELRCRPEEALVRLSVLLERSTVADGVWLQDNVQVCCACPLGGRPAVPLRGVCAVPEAQVGSSTSRCLGTQGRLRASRSREYRHCDLQYRGTLSLERTHRKRLLTPRSGPTPLHREL